MSFEKIIKDYLVKKASSDAVFAEKFYDRMNKEGDKAIEGCCSYIKNQARKEAQSGCAVIEDAKVFGWAMHYIDENIAAPATTAAARVETAPTTERLKEESLERGRKAVSAPVAEQRAKEEKRLNLILTALHISANATQQILEYFDDQFIDHKTESDWRFEKKAAANEMVKLTERIRTIHQHTFMKDINMLLTNDGTEPYDEEKWTRHEDNGRRQARRLVMECGKLLSMRLRTRLTQCTRPSLSRVSA